MAIQVNQEHPTGIEGDQLLFVRDQLKEIIMMASDLVEKENSALLLPSVLDAKVAHLNH